MRTCVAHVPHHTATGMADDDDGMVETVSKDLILIEGGESDGSSDSQKSRGEEEDIFHDIFSGGAAQGEGGETFYKESCTDKLKKQVRYATIPYMQSQN